ECIGCAACVDACDEIMSKVGRPQGLVRYDSLNGLEGKPKHFGRPRLFFYGSIATLWLLGATLAFSQTVAFEANALRLEGAPFMVVDSKVRNSLRVHLVNKTGDTQTFVIEPETESGIEYIIPQRRIELESLGSTYMPLLAILPRDQMRPGLKLRLTISMEGRDDRKASRVVEAPFVGPAR
ncbi:MAG: FixG Ig-like domain-containing protein, partial [Polyangiales bacterium]